MLPGEDGLKLCRKLRDSSQKYPNIPIIFISAIGDPADRIAGLEIGGDDYVTKPFVMRELIARIRSVLRRSSNIYCNDNENQKWAGFINENLLQTITFDKWKLDFLSRCIVDNNGVAVALSKTEFMLLTCFLKNPNQILSREQIIEHIGNDDSYDRSVDVQINRLRTKLQDTKCDHSDCPRGRLQTWGSSKKRG